MSNKIEADRILIEHIEDKLFYDAPIIIQKWFRYLVDSKKSAKTIDKYIIYLLAFIDYLANESDDVPCTNDYEDFYLYTKPSHIESYIRSLAPNTSTEYTSNQGVQWSALNSFFQFLVPRYLPKNPVENTIRPKAQGNAKISYLKTSDIARLLTHITETASPKNKNRDLCIIKLGFSTGLRISSILEIDVDDIDWDNNIIYLSNNHDTENCIMFGENLKKQLSLWIVDRKRYFHTTTNALFVSRQSNRMTDRAVAIMIDNYAKGLFDIKLTPQVMRNSCAINLYEKTGDIYLCSKQLGHKNIGSTQRYAKQSQSELKRKQQIAINILDDTIDTDFRG